jgi:predicted dehydrogenase
VEQQQLKVGIAGYGVVGKRRHQFIDQHPCLKTVAVCDQVFKEKGVMKDGVRFYPHYLQLLKEPLDVLFVSLPVYMAPDVTIAGIEKGLHVFCEKPPGQNVESVEAVLATKKAYPYLKLKYGFNHRYHDSVREAQRIIESGQMGDIVNVRGIYGKSRIVPFAGSWRSERKYAGGGILLDQGIHMVDLMRLFCGDFIEVKSYVSNNYWKCDVEDNAYALMKDRQGRIAMIHSSATQWQHRFLLEIALTEGYIELQGFLTSTKSYGEEKLVIGRRNESNTGTAREEIITYLNDNSWRDEIYEFADAVINNEPILHGTVEDALATIKLVYGIYWADPVWRETYSICNPDLENSNRRES